MLRTRVPSELSATTTTTTTTTTIVTQVAMGTRRREEKGMTEMKGMTLRTVLSASSRRACASSSRARPRLSPIPKPR